MKLASFKAMLNKMDNYIKLNRGGGKPILGNSIWNGHCMELYFL